MKTYYHPRCVLGGRLCWGVCCVGTVLSTMLRWVCMFSHTHHHPHHPHPPPPSTPPPLSPHNPPLTLLNRPPPLPSPTHPQLQAALERVRAGADIMPRAQLDAAMSTALGPHWRALLADFDEDPMAAASIGQVHCGVLHDGRRVAIKVQYPGVARSIESDVDNLLRLVRVANVLPKGLYVEAAAAVCGWGLGLSWWGVGGMAVCRGLYTVYTWSIHTLVRTVHAKTSPLVSSPLLLHNPIPFLRPFSTHPLSFPHLHSSHPHPSSPTPLISTPPPSTPPLKPPPLTSSGSKERTGTRV